jgi:hypothetical protein
MFGRKQAWQQQIREKQAAAEEALQQSIQDLETIQSYRSEVERTVKGHLKLLQENHFSERIWLSFRGEA